MNRFSSHPNHENHPLYEEPQPQDLSEARREGVCVFNSPRSAAQEVLSGVGAQDQIPKLPRALRKFFESISPEPKNHVQQERVLQEGIPVV